MAIPMVSDQGFGIMGFDGTREVPTKFERIFWIFSD